MNDAKTIAAAYKAAYDAGDTEKAAYCLAVRNDLDKLAQCEYEAQFYFESYEAGFSTDDAECV